MSADDKADESIANDYRILADLGAGASGQVRLAVDRSTGARVALKFVPAEFRERAAHEARLLSGIRHPGVMTLRRVFLEDSRGDFVIVSDFIDGDPLDVATAAVDLSTRLAILRSAAQALAFVHRRGLLHRDLKPANILVARGDRESRAILIDFGFATDRDRIAATGPSSATAGTLGFLAPELLDGGAPSTRSDLYAFGMCIHRCLAGRLPSAGLSAVDTLRLHRSTDLELPSEVARELPPGLVELVRALLRRDPMRRLGSADDVLAILTRLDGAPVSDDVAGEWIARARSLALGFGEPIEHSVAAAVRDPGPLMVALQDGADDSLLRIEIECAAAGRRISIRDHRGDASLIPSAVPRPDERTPVVVLEASRVSGLPAGSRCLVEPAIDEARLQMALLGEFGLELPPEVLPRLRAIDGFTPRSIREGLEHLIRNRALEYSGGRMRYSPHVEIPERSGAVDIAPARAAWERAEAGTRSWAEVLACAPVPVAAEVVNDAFPELSIEARSDLERAGWIAHDPQGRCFLAARSLVVVGRESMPSERAFVVRERLAHLVLREAERDPLRLAEAGLDLWRVGRHQEALPILLDSGSRLRDLGQAAATRRVLSPLLEVAGDTLTAAQRARALRLLAEVAALENRNDLAARHASDALALEGRDDDIGRACSALARTHIRSATRADLLVAGDLIQRGLALPAVTSATRAVLMTLDSQRLRKLDRLTEALRIAEAAVVSLAESRCPEACGALLEYANALSDAERFDESIAAYERMREVGTAIRRFDIGAAASGSIARLHLLLGRIEDAERILSRTERELRDVDLPGSTESTIVGLLSARNFLGDLDGARELIQRGQNTFGPGSQPLNRALFQRCAAETELRSGQIDAADRLLAECSAIIAVVGDREQLGKTEATLGALRAWRGDRAGARQAFARALRHVRRRGAGAEVIAIVAEFEAWRGRPHRAASLARRALLQSDATLPRVLRPELWLALSIARFRCGENDVAEFAQRGLALTNGSRDGARAQLVALDALGRFSAMRGDPLVTRTEIEGCFEQALALCGSPGHGKERLLVHLLRACWRERAARRWLTGDSKDAAAAANALAGAYDDVERAQRVARELGLVLEGHAALEVKEKLESLEREARLNVGLRALDRRLESMERLLEITRAINAELDPPRLLSLILDSSIDLTGARRGFLVLVKGERIDVKVARNFSQQDIAHPEFEISHSVARGVARSGDPILTSNAQSDTRLRSIASIHELRVLSVLCVPLRSRNQVLGSVYLDHPDVVDRFDAADLQVLTDFAWAAGIALERARLYQENLEQNRDLLRAKQEIERLNAELMNRVAQQERALSDAQDTLDAEHRAQKWRYDYRNFVSASPRMDEVKRTMDRITETDFPVLIQGESGTGKELVARAIHFNGRRSGKSFVPVNCAAMTESLIEAELFGHVRGAFTGADRDRKGFFELANEGTLFLDEIGDMSLEAQKRLLRVIQHNEFYRIGAKEPTRVDVRIICATHRDLKAMVQAGRFREDLYYRIRVAYVELPPLRERKGDVRLLIAQLAGELNRAGQAPTRRFTDAALQVLDQYAWPGNVRELQNEVKRLLFLRSDAPWIEVAELPTFMRGGQPTSFVATTSGTLKERLAECERYIVSEMLEQTKQNKSEAARRLGISIRGLYKVLERFRPDEAEATGEEGPAEPS